ncbi:MAG TPA: prenyltransferase/squalene oxidase repeat-containing protein, partial [Candidatus Limnocylindria bacterium]|nr:prenyltransferase/squalene oxidase repeat-containing protein [Candidatus Limnocylindria bacterium]
LAAHQDLNVLLPEPMELVRSLKFLETEDGAWTNEVFGRGAMPVGATNATAAAVTVLRNLNMPVNAAVGEWLLAQAHPQGGFLAVPGAPIPDLLSTATALHALAGLGTSFEKIKEPCLDFVDSLWINEGSFHGNWADDHLDCEYTCYGLLALGHLSL